MEFPSTKAATICTLFSLVSLFMTYNILDRSSIVKKNLAGLLTTENYFFFSGSVCLGPEVGFSVSLKNLCTRPPIPPWGARNF